MLATPGALPAGPEWVFEVQWDGLRVLADVRDGALRLTTGSGRDVTAHFPELADLVEVAPDLLLDGEVMSLRDGVPSLAALAGRTLAPVPAALARAHPVTYMVFDVLRLYGVALADRPLDERRGTLERLELAKAEAAALSPLYRDGPALLAATAQQGIAGVVAKRRDQPYRPGERDPGWVSVSHVAGQACVVGGWLPERGTGRIAALLLGLPNGAGLRFAGRVDLGPDQPDLRRALDVRLVPDVRCPFAPRPADTAGVRWCAPTTVVVVGHQGWSDGGRLRGPVLRGIRDDVDPQGLSTMY